MMNMRKCAIFVLLCCLSVGIQNGTPAQSPVQRSPQRLFTAAGKLADPSFFPIAVWLQDPANAPRYKAAGINLYVGLWEGPTEAQLAALKQAGMPLICERNAVGMAHRDDPMIAAWMHGDEPDNAQPVTDPQTGKQGYGPCIPPERVVSEYTQWKALDPSRPIMLNLGQGVANDAWIGRGAGAKLDDYRTYVKGGDIVSFDVYPVAGLDKDGENLLWYVPKGVDRLIGWSARSKPIWNCIECTRIGGPGKATPHQVRAEVWMALIHGSRGLVYFVHQFQPKFDEHALLDDPPMLAEVTAINRRIRELAPILNSPTLQEQFTASSSTEAPVNAPPNTHLATSSSAEVPIDAVVKRQGKITYLFAVGMRNGSTHGAFTLPGPPRNAQAEVLGENRILPVKSGRFTDDFQPYDVHLYRIK